MKSYLINFNKKLKNIWIVEEFSETLLLKCECFFNQV